MLEHYRALVETSSKSSDLQALLRPCNNAFKLYLKTRPPASNESARRAKTLPVEGPHPWLAKGIPEDGLVNLQSELALKSFTDRLKSFRPPQTVFEAEIGTQRRASHIGGLTFALSGDQKKAEEFEVCPGPLWAPVLGSVARLTACFFPGAGHEEEEERACPDHRGCQAAERAPGGHDGRKPRARGVCGACARPCLSDSVPDPGMAYKLQEMVAREGDEFEDALDTDESDPEEEEVEEEGRGRKASNRKASTSGDQIEG